MTPGTFCKKRFFLDVLVIFRLDLGQITLIRLKMRLQHNSLWPTSLGFSIFGLFFRLSFFSFSLLFAVVIALLLGLLAFKNFWENVIEMGNFGMEQPGVVAGNFAPSFSLNFLSIFAHI